MNISSSMKKCPFCKNQIPINSEKCPICKMTLIERIEINKREESHSIDYNLKNEINQNQSTIKNNFNFPNDNYKTKIINFINRNKLLLVFSFVLILLFFYFAPYNKLNENENKLYNYELDEKNKSNKKRNYNSLNNDNTRYIYSPSNIEQNINSSTQENKSSDKKVIDFIGIPEKYIPNGKIFSRNKRYFKGLGELIIKNGTNNDAVIKLVPTSTKKSVLTIYIRKNSNFTIKKIRDGNYKLYFIVGKHYDENSSIFLQDCTCAVFEKLFKYTTIKYRMDDNIKTEYYVYEITLNPVVGGTARTYSITKKEFLLL